MTCSCATPATYVAIWGSNPYTYDSNICTSALHAGLISSAGGNVTVSRIAAQGYFASSYNNGINAYSWGYYEAMQLQPAAASSNTAVPAAITYASCAFNGQTIAHGGSVTAYAASSVTSPNSCTAQTRTCSNGTLSGSYSYSSCSVTAAPVVSSCNTNSAYCGGYGEALWYGSCDRGTYAGWKVQNGAWVSCY